MGMTPGPSSCPIDRAEIQPPPFGSIKSPGKIYTKIPMAFFGGGCSGQKNENPSTSMKTSSGSFHCQLNHQKWMESLSIFLLAMRY